jgi:hypothetical protein
MGGDDILRATRRAASSSANSTTRRPAPRQPAILALPLPFLWASDAAHFDAVTHQRQDVLFDGQSGKPAGKPLSTAATPRLQECIETPTGVRLTWHTGQASVFSHQWVAEQLQLYQQQQQQTTSDLSSNRIHHWSHMDEATLRQSTLVLPFDQLGTANGMQHALRTLYQHGILLVQETPVDDQGAGVAALGAALGGAAVKTPDSSLWPSYFQPPGATRSTDLVLPHGTDGPLRTLYGTVWATSSAHQAAGASTADSAYGTRALPLHTDLTYHGDPPGLQIFTMVHPATVGGQSVFADGFFAAERLRERDPPAFALLSSLPRRYRSKDSQTGWHLEASGPVIQSDAWGRVLSIRHNDLDRLPDVPPPHLSTHAKVATFYEELVHAHEAWDRILGDDATRLVVSLKAGETMVVANQVGWTLCL